MLSRVGSRKAVSWFLLLLLPYSPYYTVSHSSYDLNLSIQYISLCLSELIPSVLVIGGGIVGVELAAEILEHFPQKRVTIAHSGELIAWLIGWLISYRYPSFIPYFSFPAPLGSYLMTNSEINKKSGNPHLHVYRYLTTYLTAFLGTVLLYVFPYQLY